MRFFVVPIKYIKIALSVVILLIMLACNISNESMAQVYFGGSLRRVPIYAVDTTEKKVAISFDAAWGADKTRDIMNALERYDCNATFFLVGFWIDKYSDIVKEIEARGFEIGSHSNTHPDLTKLSAEKIALELSSVSDKLKPLLKNKVRVFRFPFGAYNNKAIEEVEKQGFVPVQWSIDSLDWKGISAAKISANILSKVKSGDIILCHNNADNIVEALDTVLPMLISKGYKVVSVSELLYSDGYSINSQGIQIKNGD